MTHRNEFSLIDVFFKTPAFLREDVVYGIGDDAACVEVPPDYQLFISTDTLVAEVHFLSEWDAYDIACKAVMVNVSDMAAMGASPCWVSLALTLPEYDEHWLTRFAQGFHASLKQFGISLIGGDTTRGPLSITITIHGLAPRGQGVRRQGASAGDTILVTGELGAAALAVLFLERKDVAPDDRNVLMDKLQHPRPRVDFINLLRQYASAAIDISDGLSADLSHICEASGVGACLTEVLVPVHPLVKKYQRGQAVSFALGGGDDYELCFTLAADVQNQFMVEAGEAGLTCYPIGIIEKPGGLRLLNKEGGLMILDPLGYRHF